VAGRATRWRQRAAAPAAYAGRRYDAHGIARKTRAQGQTYLCVKKLALLAAAGIAAARNSLTAAAPHGAGTAAAPPARTAAAISPWYITATSLLPCRLLAPGEHYMAACASCLLPAAPPLLHACPPLHGLYFLLPSCDLTATLPAAATKQSLRIALQQHYHLCFEGRRWKARKRSYRSAAWHNMATGVLKDGTWHFTHRAARLKN